MSNSFSVFAVALALNEPSKSVWHPRSTRDRSPSSFTSSIPNKASASLANKPRSRISFTQQNLKRVLFSRKKLTNSLHSKVLRKHLQKSTGKEISTFSYLLHQFKGRKEEFLETKRGNSIVWWLNWLQLDSELASFIHPILSNSFFFGGISKVGRVIFFQFSGNHWRQISIKSSKARNSSR